MPYIKSLNIKSLIPDPSCFVVLIGMYGVIQLAALTCCFAFADVADISDGNIFIYTVHLVGGRCKKGGVALL